MAVSNKLKVGLIFGGRSGEHEVSLASARSVLSALNQEKYDIIQIGITPNGQWITGPDVLGFLSSHQASPVTNCTILPEPTRSGIFTLERTPSGEQINALIPLDVIIPILHGTFGEDGTLQGLLELAEMPYVGAGVVGSAVGMDKGIFKSVMVAHNIPIVDWMLVERTELQSQPDQVLEQVQKLGSFPFFTKPANLGSSVGITKCRTLSDLMEGMLEAARYDRRIIIECGLNAREIEISVLGNSNPIASVPGEIRPAADFYSYAAKYQDDRSELLIPAPIPTETTEMVQELAVKAYKAIDCAGMARVDFLLDRDTNQLYMNEVNTIPGFTQISMYPKLWQASGISYPDLLDRLIDLAMERHNEKAKTEYRI